MADVILQDLPSLATKEVVDEGIEEWVRENLYIGLPARVVGVQDYETLQCIDVESAFELINTASSTMKPFTLKKVFVKLDSGGGFSAKFPVKVGDFVTLHFSHRQLGQWLDGDGETLTQSELLTGMLNDCWATLGFGTRKNHQSPSQTDYVFEGPKTSITVKTDGSVTTETTTITENVTDRSTTASSTVISSPSNTINGPLAITGNVTAPTGTISTLTAPVATLGAVTFTTISSGGMTGITAAFPNGNGQTLNLVNGIAVSITPT